MHEQRNMKIWMPLLFSIVLITGIFIGIKLNIKGGNAKQAINNEVSSDKISQILNVIDQMYVDTVNNDQISDLAIDALLQNLDPHSSYIPAKELKATNEQLSGSFDGIGVEFNIQKDTIMVVNAVSGGPAEKVGVKTGDRIVKIEGKNVAGIKITNPDVFKKLRGKKGTIVTIGVLRKGLKSLKYFTITRDEIPNKSLDAAFMIDGETGYMKLGKFSATSYSEFKNASQTLLSQGMTRLIFDLRGNGGGYLDAAIAISDEFLPKEKLIVYTQGKARPRVDDYATRRGDLEKVKLVILIDEFSASASEIVSGAIQDNDRGIICGRRSFGKGLVQEQMMLPDSSAIRLTVARYYTPSGRCIQKPYGEGVGQYYSEFLKRFSDGELQTADSIKLNKKEKFKTVGGRTVYGGGGIMPDVFVPIDTIGHSSYLNKIAELGLINQYAFDFCDKNRDMIKLQYRDKSQFASKFKVDEKMMSDFIAYAAQNGVPKNPAGIATSGNIIRTQLKALIGRHLFGFDLLFRTMLDADNTYKQAYKEIKKQ